MYAEAEKDILKIQQLRQYSEVDFPPETPGEFLVKSILKNPENRVLYRVEKPPVDPSIPSLGVNWQEQNMPEDDSKEFEEKFGDFHWALPKRPLPQETALPNAQSDEN